MKVGEMSPWMGFGCVNRKVLLDLQTSFEILADS